MSTYTDSELAQMDRAAERRIDAESFRKAHREYATPVVLSATEIAAMDDTMELAS
jgi:hypothetical protein